jgi:hypothetical protein
MRLPGFTADASLYGSRPYRLLARYENSGTVIPQLPVRGPGGLEWVDCNEPFAYYCLECSSITGILRCCRTGNCVVIDRI